MGIGPVLQFLVASGKAVDFRGGSTVGSSIRAGRSQRRAPARAMVRAAGVLLGVVLMAGLGVLQVGAQGAHFAGAVEGTEAVTSNGVTVEGSGSVNFGAVVVGSAGPAMTVSFEFTAGDSGISASVVTLGAKGLDFADAGGGSCDTNGTSYVYSAGGSCSVNVTFAPKYAGARYGAVVLSDASGAIATAYIYGTGQAPELVFFGSQTIETLGGGFYFPVGVTADASGNTYVADYSNNAVKEIPAGCVSSSCVVTLGGGFDEPWRVAVDGGGNIYVADYGNNAVKKMPPGCASGSCVTALGGGFVEPHSVKVDGSGNVYVADNDATAVKEMPPGCISSSCVTALGGGFDYVYDVAVDGSGNIYAADTFNNMIKEMPPGCASAACVTELGGGFDYPEGVAVDASGSIYIADFENNAVKEMPAGCASSSCVTTLGVGFSFPSSVTVDGGGNVYVADTFNSAVKELILASPPGLTFANTNAGSQSSPQTLSLTNIGNAPLTFPVPGTGENPSVAANYTLDPSTTCPVVQTSSSAGMLGAGASCELAVDFAPTTIGAIAGAVILTDNNQNASPAVTQSIRLNGAGSTPIVPYIQVDTGPWQNVASLTVNYGDTANLGPQPASGGSWSWTGPNGFTSTSRGINGIPLTLPTNVFTATYTDTAGVTSTLTFTITVNPTPITPYLEVNGGAWQNTSTVAVNYTDTVNLAPWPTSGGSWSWAGPNNFTANTREIAGVALPSGTNTYTATYTNQAGVTSTQAFVITVNSTAITPYLEVNGGAWQNVASATVAYGSTVNLGPWPQSGGTWSWTGPNGFTSASRAIYGVPLTPGANIYVATYTNSVGVTSTEAFTLDVSTPIIPYMQVGNGPWQNVASLTANYGDTVNLGPWPESGGTWSWTGPNSFTSASRALYGIPLTQSTNTYTATYTNSVGATSTQSFTITVNPTPISPYLQVDGGAWQNVANFTVNYTDSVNLAPWPTSGGTWSWIGPNSFTANTRAIYGIALPSGTNTYTATYTNPSGVTSTQAFIITVNSTPVSPYLEVDGGAWQNAPTVAVNYTDTVNLAPWPTSGGTWSWTGPNNFTANTRAINGISIPSGTNVYTATYTNPAGVKSTQVFTITVNPTPIVPYIEVGGGAWQSESSVTVSPGSTVNLGPWPVSGGTWLWTGPGGFTSTARAIYGIPLSVGTNSYVATYTNAAGVTSVETFTISVK